MILEEDDIRIEFTNAIDAMVFDEVKDKKATNYHGVPDMSRVDFIVEIEKAYLFVEIKDPATPRARPEALLSFTQKVEEGKLSNSFASKFIDTFLYRWAENKVDKQIYYISLVTIDGEKTPALSDSIAKKIPPYGNEVSRWKQPLFENCQVFNLDQWNDNFGHIWPATRISAQAS